MSHPTVVMKASDEGQWWWSMMKANDEGQWWWPMMMANDDGQWWWPMMMANDDGQWWWPMMMANAAVPGVGSYPGSILSVCVADIRFMCVFFSCAMLGWCMGLGPHTWHGILAANCPKVNCWIMIVNKTYREIIVPRWCLWVLQISAASSHGTLVGPYNDNSF